jgi:hypothetical protein
MSFFSKLFGAKGAKYNDEQLVAQAEIAIAADPLISDPTGLVVTSKKGMVTLSGIVQRPQEKDRIEGVVRNAFTTVGLKHGDSSTNSNSQSIAHPLILIAITKTSGALLERRSTRRVPLWAPNDRSPAGPPASCSSG